MWLLVSIILILQLIGNNEEILDIQLFGSNEEYMALATNSISVKVYSLADFDRFVLFLNLLMGAYSQRPMRLMYKYIFILCMLQFPILESTSQISEKKLHRLI